MGALYMGGCQNYGPFLGTINNRCRIIIGTQKRDHNFDNHPYGEQKGSKIEGLKCTGLRYWCRAFIVITRFEGI